MVYYLKSMLCVCLGLSCIHFELNMGQTWTYINQIFSNPTHLHIALLWSDMKLVLENLATFTDLTIFPSLLIIFTLGSIAFGIYSVISCPEA